MAALAAVFLVVLGMFVGLVVNVQALNSSSKAGRRAADVRESAIALERAVVDMESDLRSYLITQDPRFRKEYDVRRRDVPRLANAIVARSNGGSEMPEDIRADIGDFIHSYSD